MATRFGRDFGDVRIHTGDRAARAAHAARARAFTTGNDVVFARGAYRPGTPDGGHLLAHELVHVLQQSEGRSAGLGVGSPDTLHRQQDAGLPPGGLPAPGTIDPVSDTTATQGPPEPTGVLFQVGQPGSRRVQRIVMARDDMMIRIETAGAIYLYHLESCTIPIGSYEPTVTIDGNDFNLDFGRDVAPGLEFGFSYRVDPGQENPARFLRDQRSVNVEVVAHLSRPVPPDPRQPPDPRRPPGPQCAVRFPDRELVPVGSMSKRLFAPVNFKKTLWSQAIPLGMYGWVDVAAVASGGASGTFSASYGPGRLTDICLTHVTDRVSSSAPIESPFLGPESSTEVTTYTLGGRARFDLPARLAVRLAANGRLKISGDYLSVIEVAAAEGSLSASAEASLSGAIHAAVDVAATVTASRVQLDGLLGGRVAIEDVSLGGVDLSAEVGARGRVGLRFRVDAGAAFSVAGYELWRETWNLARFNAGLSWSGGIRYSPNPGLHWDLGSVAAAGADPTADDVDAETDELPIHEDEADIDADSVVDAIFNEEHDTEEAPDGLDPDRPLPFDWYKPMSLYPTVVAIPNADDPKELHRDSGPTDVRHTVGGRTVHDEIGVADWPLETRDFQFMPYNGRSDPKKRSFNALLRRLGYTGSASGTDADHVWDIYLLGLDYDRYDNLWPASNQDQQLAGTRHKNQIRAYEQTIGNVAGRHFRIIRERHPA